jgi:hypothetical protein
MTVRGHATTGLRSQEHVVAAADDFEQTHPLDVRVKLRHPRLEMVLLDRRRMADGDDKLVGRLPGHGVRMLLPHSFGSLTLRGR